MLISGNVLSIYVCNASIEILVELRTIAARYGDPDIDFLQAKAVDLLNSRGGQHPSNMTIMSIETDSLDILFHSLPVGLFFF